MYNQTSILAQIPLAELPSPGGFPLLPSLLLTGALLAGLSALIWKRPSTLNPTSKIQREVNGDFRDPDSTRDLYGISAEELQLFRTATEAGLKEAEAFAVMPDTMFRMAVRNADSVSARYGLPESNGYRINMEEAALEDLRNYFDQRWDHLVSFQEKLSKSEVAEGLFSILGITPSEYEHLVNSLQAEYRTAVVYSQMSVDQAKRGCEFVDQTMRDLGLDGWAMYLEQREDLPGWMAGRLPVIEGVLERVNVAYEGAEYLG